MQGITCVYSTTPIYVHMYYIHVPNQNLQETESKKKKREKSQSAKQMESVVYKIYMK